MRSLVLPRPQNVWATAPCSLVPHTADGEGGWEGGMLLQFCRYHIQNYRSYKQGELETNLRTNQNSSRGSRKRQEPQRGEWEVGSCCWHCGLTPLTHPCCWTLSQPPHLVAEFPLVQAGRGRCGGEGAGVPGEQLLRADVGTSP